MNDFDSGSVVFQIVMEYCGAGSVSDIMRIRKKTLNEAEIAAVTRSFLFHEYFLLCLLPTQIKVMLKT